MSREEQLMSFVAKVSEHRCANDSDCEEKPDHRHHYTELGDRIGAVSLHEADGADDLHGVRCYERKGQRKEQREEEIVEWTTSVITKLEDEDFLDHSSVPLLPALTRWK